jgi:hypothetical protein
MVGIIVSESRKFDGHSNQCAYFLLIVFVHSFNLRFGCGICFCYKECVYNMKNAFMNKVKDRND